MKPEYYEAILERLQNEYGIKVDRTEHVGIAEFYEGPLPLFKLILAQNEGTETYSALVSFQIQLDIPTAVQWWVRLRNLDPNLMVAASYIKDAEGTSYVGDDAEIALMYMIEQDVISSWMQSEKDAEEVLNQKISHAPSPARVYTNYRKALQEFNKMKKNKGDVSH